MVTEVKVQMILKLIESKRITVDDIKDPTYKAEIEARLATQ